MSCDDWKGEHLIKTVKTDHKRVPSGEFSPQARAKKKAPKKTCAVPGCRKVVTPNPNGNGAGVCRHHNHTKPYCQCRQCRKTYE